MGGWVEQHINDSKPFCLHIFLFTDIIFCGKEYEYGWDPLHTQPQKTSHLRGFVFLNYRNLNNGNLLLGLGEILKQKLHKMTKNGMLKLTYKKAL